MFAGLILLLVAGGMDGSFALPMKYVRGWKWEHTWPIWSLLGMAYIHGHHFAHSQHLGFIDRRMARRCKNDRRMGDCSLHTAHHGNLDHRIIRRRLVAASSCKFQSQKGRFN